MEVALAVGSLKVAYNLAVFGIKLDQVPAAVRRCLELVRTCHYDLEALIKLRNEYLPLLETKPAILERINTIIQNAHKGLLEVARLVEKLRPEAHGGNSSLRGRLEWMFIDSREFSSQEPLVSRQHSSVIAELNFLRHLVLLTPLLDGAGAGNVTGLSSPKRPAVAWENVALLDEMLGGKKRLSASTASETPPLRQSASMYFLGSSGASDTTCGEPGQVDALPSDELPPYSSPRPSGIITAAPSTASQPPVAPATFPLIYHATISGAQTPSDTELSQRALGLKTCKTTFDGDGVAFLFGDLKRSINQGISPAMHSPPSEQVDLTIHQRNGHGLIRPMTSPPPPSNDPPGTGSHHPSLATTGPPKGQGYAAETGLAALCQQSHLQANSEFAATPLSTIPQELIHRQDGFFGYTQQPAVQPILTRTQTTPLVTYYPSEGQTRQQSALPGQQIHPSSAPRNTATSSSNIAIPRISVQLSNATWESSRNPASTHLQNIASHPPAISIQQHGVGPSFDVAELQRPRLRSSSVPGDVFPQNSQLTLRKPVASHVGAAEGATAHATTREHWEPEYLAKEYHSTTPVPQAATQHGGRHSRANSAYAAGMRDMSLGYGEVSLLPSARDASFGSQNGHFFSNLDGSTPYFDEAADRTQSEIYELPGVPLPPEPSELG